MLGDQGPHAPVDPNLARHRLCVRPNPVHVSVPDGLNIHTIIWNGSEIVEDTDNSGEFTGRMDFVS